MDNLKYDTLPISGRMRQGRRYRDTLYTFY